MRQQTWFTSVVCIIAVLPGLAVALLFGLLMRVFAGFAWGSDFLYLRAIFGMETPGKIYEWVFAQAVPTTIQSIIAGYLAVRITEKICKGANTAKAAQVTGSIYTVYTICIILWAFVDYGVTAEGILPSILQIVGLWIGLMVAVAVQPVPEDATV